MFQPDRIQRVAGYLRALPPAILVAAVVVLLALGGTSLMAVRAVAQVLTPDRPATPVTLSGTIAQIGDGEWLIDGVAVRIDARTAISGVPAVGARAEVSGVLRDDGALYAERVTIEPGASPIAQEASPPPLAPTQAPTEAPEPTAVPEPTAAPLPTEAPAAAPLPPAPVGNVFVALRMLIEIGIADGRVRPNDGESLLRRLDDAEQAAAEGRMDRLHDRLRDLQRRTIEQVREEKMDAGLGQQLLDAIVAIAAGYGLPLDGEDRRGGGGNGGDGGNGGGNGGNGGDGGDDGGNGGDGGGDGGGNGGDGGDGGDDDD